MTEHWYVAQCLPKNESLAILNIRKQGFNCYWPRYELKQRIGLKRSYYHGVFPTYLFVQFDVRNRAWKALCNTYGIRKILGATEQGVLPLPPGFVEDMVDNNPDGVMEAPKQNGTNYIYGDQVRIMEGALAGHRAILQYSEKGRVGLLLTLLGRKVSVKMPVDKIQHAGMFI
jgi:transcriptional antiterminator RfaH